jgi:hypothetical protein
MVDEAGRAIALDMNMAQYEHARQRFATPYAAPKRAIRSRSSA